MSGDYERSSSESEIIDEFFEEYFRPGYTHDPNEVGSQETEDIDHIVKQASELYSRGKAYYGLLLDFVLLAEKLSQVDSSLNVYEGSLTPDDLFSRYDRKDTKTLTIILDDDDYGIRGIHEDIIDLFRNLGRTNFPSSAPHTTADWSDYEEDLALAFRLSRPARYQAVDRLIDFGLKKLTKRTFDARDTPLPRPFTEIVCNYPRKHPDEQAGSAYQAISYGYVKAEWPHLSLRTSKLRTGSSRQNRTGDVDGYIGPDLMVSLEAKDKIVDDNVVERELLDLCQLAEETGAIALVMCRDVTDEAWSVLQDSGVLVLTDEELKEHLQFWDYHKQNDAVQGMVHYFKNVEENPDATKRVLEFLEEVDPENSAVATLTGPPNPDNPAED
jgi:hypothetical protein